MNHYKAFINIATNNKSIINRLIAKLLVYKNNKDKFIGLINFIRIYKTKYNLSTSQMASLYMRNLNISWSNAMKLAFKYWKGNKWIYKKLKQN
jgi:hypothetical protein